MQLTSDDVKKVAALAKLDFSEAELIKFAKELGDIVHLVEQLADVPTDNVQPMAHPLDVHSFLRPDEIRPGLQRADALSTAPKSDGEYFLVPPVLAR
jgi:aspartyl-tRNA(Asn)/glutamyl-tRNA(Gln) amidotransferase subunit C